MSTPDIHTAVQDTYANAARCAPDCGANNRLAAGLYDVAERTSLPEDAVAAALGCANPSALANLQPGETVLDLAPVAAWMSSSPPGAWGPRGSSTDWT